MAERRMVEPADKRSNMADKKTGSRAAGYFWEEKAAAYLAAHGYEILCRNFYSRQGEIDIIAKESGYLVFAEVKFRTDSSCGFPGEAVDKRKEGRIVKAARYYMFRNGIGDDTPCRFDVVSIEGGKISVIQNAFDAL